MNNSSFPKISVIVPAYNVELWLARCINSIIRQLYPNLEIIIIDDGSSDKTWEIIQKYMELDNRVRGIHQENKGLIAVRDIGIKAASGDFIAFVDGDDSISCEMYERLINNAVRYNADISGCGILYIFDDGKPIKHWGTNNVQVYKQHKAINILLTGNRIEPSLCNKIYKKEIIINSCVNDTILCNEDLIRNYVAFSRATTIVIDDFCGYNYYRRNGSMSNNSNKLQISKDIIEAQECLLEICDKQHICEVRVSYVMHAISAINKLMNWESEEVKVFIDKCRTIVVKQKKYIKYLPVIQQIEAIMILMSLNFYKQIYNSAKRIDRMRI